MIQKKETLKTFPLGFNWPVQDPFLFCVHHKDAYPQGNEDQGPSARQLGNRSLGSDFQNPSGWSMYHGRTVPGFPEHPHRGFETVTIVLEGLVDHSDSSGATGRYGGGDVQWMTAGSGMQHAEMFPMVHQDKPNPLELFQIWLNLPAKDKFVKPNYKMLWSEQIPIITKTDTRGRETTIRLISGQVENIKSLKPTPDSWASSEANHVSIWLAEMAPGAVYTLPAVSETLNRTLYFYEGESLSLDGAALPSYHGCTLDGGRVVELVNGTAPAKFLLLEAEPINEPVVQYGPFVMNTREEIVAASRDYQATAFGGWPWKRSDPVNPQSSGRFARYEDGTVETP
ncbi:MAG: pirin family protein [Acidaminobacter sp.]|uniref:pirin family protein n=1 Tax=Acidaminobacter sp. TaxID=1872102 RepID=UPI001381438A|nr:pirin family protein [Acidaminobacter sp.]MZQ97895.1 pirin family protein [Acidaminobacter sp.]